MNRRRLGFAIWLATIASCSGGEMPTGGSPDAAQGAADAAADAAIGSDPDATTTEYACAPAPGIGSQVVSCPGGVEVSVAAPSSCPAAGCGLILDIHGFTMDADQEDAHTRMRTLATAREYVVAQPSAPGSLPSWAGGEQDDTVWSFALAAMAVLPIDPRRVHVMGFSQGGEMTLRLVCAHADVIASAAPSAGAACFDAATPSREIPLLYTHGTSDSLISYPLVAEPLRDAILATWDFGGASVVENAEHHRVTRWTTTAGTVFEMRDHDFNTATPLLGGHCLPGPDDGGTYRCQQSAAHDHSLAVLDFFDAYRLAD